MALTLVLRSLLLLVVATCVLLDVTVEAAQIMRRPDGFTIPPHNLTITTDPQTKFIHKRSGPKVQMGYFTNWYCF